MNHRKKTKADGSRLIPRKHTETLVLLSTVTESHIISKDRQFTRLPTVALCAQYINIRNSDSKLKQFYHTDKFSDSLLEK